MKSKHTPGPWEWDGKFKVCIPHEKGLTCFRTNPEDARLIAAAPDLLEALDASLKLLSEAFKRIPARSGQTVCMQIVDHNNKLRDLIARATGGEE